MTTSTPSNSICCCSGPSWPYKGPQLTRLANTTARAALRDIRGVLEAAVRYASIYDPARFLAEGMVST